MPHPPIRSNHRYGLGKCQAATESRVSRSWGQHLEAPKKQAVKLPANGRYVVRIERCIEVRAVASWPPARPMTSSLCRVISGHPVVYRTGSSIRQVMLYRSFFAGCSGCLDADRGLELLRRVARDYEWSANGPGREHLENSGQGRLIKVRLVHGRAGVAPQACLR